MFPEWPAEFIEYSRDKSKNFLLKKFLNIYIAKAFVVYEHGQVEIFLK